MNRKKVVRLKAWMKSLLGITRAQRVWRPRFVRTNPAVRGTPPGTSAGRTERRNTGRGTGISTWVTAGTPKRQLYGSGPGGTGAPPRRTILKLILAGVVGFHEVDLLWSIFECSSGMPSNSCATTQAKINFNFLRENIFVKTFARKHFREKPRIQKAVGSYIPHKGRLSGAVFFLRNHWL